MSSRARGCFVRYRVGKEAVKKISFINELRNEGQFAAVSDLARPPSIESVPTPHFETFQSTELAMNVIMRALLDESINSVGVYGMGGNIQGEIAENLGLKLEEESESMRGRRLLERLKKEKGILMILDDLWAPLKLANIGIPFGDDSSKQCKGDCVVSAALHIVAKEVAKECGGLPIALVTLGKALHYEISENDLFPYVIGERVFKDVESLMEARDQLHTVLNKLQASCLLLKAEYYDRSVKMHDVVRDVAIEIAREDHGFEIKVRRGLEE
ncbi:hypothetical protein NE237_004836 [Protea cynaroides]|uniref:NB-ARC domain-containing protein n=1 Tax=Protea cynaroides TaxID=273540 RepID=A0A9Q0KJI3_9MAGN|nr:hypothetical protein NE237_004836 [Protea cynaroides]